MTFCEFFLYHSGLAACGDYHYVLSPDSSVSPYVCLASPVSALSVDLSPILTTRLTTSFYVFYVEV